MIEWFAKFPTIGYDVDGSGTSDLMIDILERVKIRDSLKNDRLIFYQYAVKDGETPEIIADKLYGSSQYHWIVLLVNNIIDPYYDWPMSIDNLNATIRKKYATSQLDGLIYAYSTTHHYTDSLGNVIDETTFLSLPVSERTKVSVYDWEVAQNEAKRQISLLDAKYVTQIDTEANQIMVSPILQ